MLWPSRNGATPRVKSPRPGISTLMTSAPSAPSTQVQYGPASMWVQSTTRRPASGPGRPASLTGEHRLPLREEGVDALLQVAAREDLLVPARPVPDRAAAGAGAEVDDLLRRLHGERRVGGQEAGQLPGARLEPGGSTTRWASPMACASSAPMS